MAKQSATLRKIVALKRQSAEQHLRAVQIEADRIETVIAALRAQFLELDHLRAGFDAHRLSEAHGHVRKLLADIGAAEAELARKHADLHAAREAVKRVFHSEERLGQARPAG
ncbi:MAG: hypothetical protein ACK4P2_03060 [Hyphomonas sp.]